MGFPNLNWYNTNALRNYPLEDSCSRTDDTGAVLPNNIITDLHIWFPGAQGTRAYIGSVGITSGLVSLTVVTVSGTLLATLTLPRPVTVNKSYSLTPVLAGTTGWVSFGDGVSTNQATGVSGSWLFSDSNATLLLPRVTEAYTVDGVTSLRKTGRTTGLTGQVRLVSGLPDTLKIQKGIRTIGGRDRPCLVFSLNVAGKGVDVYKRFLGCCDGTPENKTCLAIPIAAINQVVPDCSGLIYLNFTEPEGEGGAPLLTFDISGSTALIDFTYGLSDVCSRPTVDPEPPMVGYCDDSAEIIDPGPFAS